jgi:membrane AbrB-like protein
MPSQLPTITPGLVFRSLTTVFAAFVGAEVANFLHIPLPWMLGSMFGVACITLAGQVYPQPKWARRSAQVFIGSALGLFFTPLIFQQLWGLLPWITIGAASVILMSLMVAPLLQKMAGLDGPTTLYAIALGGASEMSAQAQEVGADAPMVALSHTVRIVMVMLTTSLIAGASSGALPLPDTTVQHLSVSSAILLLIGSYLMGMLFVRLHIGSAWKLGALLVGALCALSGLQGRWPQEGIVITQIIIGWGLGQNMTRSFFTRAPMAMLAMAATTLLLMAGCMGVAWFLSQQINIPLITAFLAMAPGGMTEMGLIAKLFGLAVPMVITFHLLRMVFALLFTQPVGRWLIRMNWIKT